MEKPKNISRPDTDSGAEQIRSGYSAVRSWLPAILLISVFIYSCDEGTLSGTQQGDREVQIKADTVLIPSTEEVSAPGFSGNLNYLSAGSYNDQLFGNQEVTALLHPSINSENLESIDSDASAYLELAVDEIYGDLNSTTAFELHEITRRWRANSWRPDSSIADATGQLTIGEGDYDPEDETLIVPVDQSWLQEFREFFNEGDNDEYREQQFGFALNASAPSNILSFDMDDSRMVVDNPSVDSLQYTGFRGWAYSQEREELNENIPESTSLNFNTFENFMKLEFEVSRDFIQAENISRAELVIHKDAMILEDYLPEGHRRNDADILELYFLNESDLELSVTDDPRFQVNLSDEDSNAPYYSINLTEFVKERLRSDGTENRRFYAIISYNNGKLLQSALFNHEHDEFAPKLLITSADPN